MQDKPNIEPWQDGQYSDDLNKDNKKNCFDTITPYSDFFTSDLMN